MRTRKQVVSRAGLSGGQSLLRVLEGTSRRGGTPRGVHPAEWRGEPPRDTGNHRLRKKPTLPNTENRKVVLPTGVRGRRFGVSCRIPSEDLQGRSRCSVPRLANACLIDVPLMSAAK